jgi:hypothetical protein
MMYGSHRISRSIEGGIMPPDAPNSLLMMVALMAAHRAVTNQTDEDIPVFDQAAVSRMCRYLAERRSAQDKKYLTPRANWSNPDEGGFARGRRRSAVCEKCRRPEPH